MKSNTTFFNIDNGNKCFLIRKSAYYISFIYLADAFIQSDLQLGNTSSDSS